MYVLIYGTMETVGQISGPDLLLPPVKRIISAFMFECQMFQNNRLAAVSESRGGRGSSGWPGQPGKHQQTAESWVDCLASPSSSVKTLFVVLTLIALWCWHSVLTDASLSWVLFWLMMGLSVASLTLPRVSQHFLTPAEHWNFIRIANWRRIAHVT